MENINLKTVKEIECFLKSNEKLQKMFHQCFYSTLERSTIWEDDTPYVITGDIYAMWLRDSSAQVTCYLPFIKESDALRDFIIGVINRQIHYIMIDPYANAFNREMNDRHSWHDETKTNPWVWERKYEIDSLCYAVKLIYDYTVCVGDIPFKDKAENPGENTDARFTAVGRLSQLFRTIIRLWRAEQDHFGKSEYRFYRNDTLERDTLHNRGMGNPVNYTGMTWSGFRPSDDACVFGYNIPQNLFACTALKYISELAGAYLNKPDIVSEADALYADIIRGVNNYGIFLHPKYGRIYAYETDGYGNYVLQDDANAPSLLSLKLLSKDVIDEEIYRNTRKFVLSKDNPVFVNKNDICGIGSVHTPDGYIWHIALIMQAMTSDDKKEISDILNVLQRTDADTGYMHESFNPDNPLEFTRAWFSWADGLFAQLIMRVYNDPQLRELLL